MKGFLCGAIAGSMIGAVAAAIVMPYAEPELNHALKKCRRMVRCKIRRMF